LSDFAAIAHKSTGAPEDAGDGVGADAAVFPGNDEEAPNEVDDDDEDDKDDEEGAEVGVGAGAGAGALERAFNLALGGEKTNEISSDPPLSCAS